MSARARSKTSRVSPKTLVLDVIAFASEEIECPIQREFRRWGDPCFRFIVFDEPATAVRSVRKLDISTTRLAIIGPSMFEQAEDIVEALRSQCPECPVVLMHPPDTNPAAVLAADTRIRSIQEPIHFSELIADAVDLLAASGALPETAISKLQRRVGVLLRRDIARLRSDRARVQKAIHCAMRQPSPVIAINARSVRLASEKR
jgi:ElaB/YqjD/DUF883 family membrane-anchored ribosome-binding protein